MLYSRPMASILCSTAARSSNGLKRRRTEDDFISLPNFSQRDADRNIHHLASYPMPRHKRAKTTATQEPLFPLERLRHFAGPRAGRTMEHARVTAAANATAEKKKKLQFSTDSMQRKRTRNELEDPFYLDIEEFRTKKRPRKQDEKEIESKRSRPTVPKESVIAQSQVLNVSRSTPQIKKASASLPKTNMSRPISTWFENRKRENGSTTKSLGSPIPDLRQPGDYGKLLRGGLGAPWRVLRRTSAPAPVSVLDWLGWATKDESPQFSLAIRLKSRLSHAGVVSVKRRQGTMTLPMRPVKPCVAPRPVQRDEEVAQQLGTTTLGENSFTRAAEMKPVQARTSTPSRSRLPQRLKGFIRSKFSAHADSDIAADAGKGGRTVMKQKDRSPTRWSFTRGWRLGDLR